MYTIPIIEKLGGREVVAAKVTRPAKGRRKPITRHALNMWVARNSIPGFAVVQLLELATASGITIEPDDFRRRGQSHRKKKLRKQVEHAEP